jgi:hypothetical protein
MRRGEWERFDPRAVDASLRLLGAALLACVATDAWAGAWRVHGGDLFPWRHLPGVPLYGHAGLAFEWALGVAAGSSLLASAGRSRPPLALLALWSGALATALGLSQRFSNHRALLLIVLVFVGLAPPRTRDPDFAARARPNLALVRAQLVLVYVFSVVHKACRGFTSGAALASLFGWSHAPSQIAAWGTLAIEALVPVLLLKAPRVGLAVGVALHVAMAVLLPSVWPFSFAMVAMGALFLYPRPPIGGPRSDATGSGRAMPCDAK